MSAETNHPADPVVMPENSPASAPSPWATMSRAALWWFIALAGAAALVLGLGTLRLVGMLARPLALLILGITVAEALSPLVARLDRRLPRLAAIVVIYGALALLLGVLGWLVVPPLADQLETAAERLPSLIAEGEQLVNRLGQLLDPDLLGMLSSSLGQTGGRLVQLPVSVATSLVDIFLVLFISIYWLIAVPALHRFTLSLFPRARRRGVARVLRRMGQAMGGYVRGSAINAVIVGVLIYAGLLIIGVDYALALALQAGLLEIITVIGPIVASVPILLVALLQSPTTALITLIFLVVMQQIENHILVPNIMRTQTDVPPLLVVLALFAGATAGGLLGALVAIPLAAALRVVVVQLIAPAVRRWTGAPPHRDGERDG